MTGANSKTTATGPTPKGQEYDDGGVHKSEFVYNTPLSNSFHLHELNKSIHTISSVPHAVEFVLFLFGYAFNPVSIPLWCVLFAATSTTTSSPYEIIVSYLTSVVTTLVATEIGKFSFATTRPKRQSYQSADKIVRRYAYLVTSLKSKHSFPSGDVAQAANVCFFLLRFLTSFDFDGENEENIYIRKIAMCAILLPGVCFARVFYHCHWVEDCLGGILLAALLYQGGLVPYFVENSQRLVNAWFS